MNFSEQFCIIFMYTAISFEMTIVTVTILKGLVNYIITIFIGLVTETELCLP